MRSRWRRGLKAWGRLGWPARFEIVYVTMLAAVAEIAVRLVPVRRLASVTGISMEGLTPDTSSLQATLSSEQIARRTEAVQRVYRVWPRDGSCLRESFVLGFRLRHSRPVLKLGVAKENEEVVAHAWIEIDGRPVGDDPQRFSPLHGRPAQRR